MIMQALRTKTRVIMMIVVVIFVISLFAMYNTGRGKPASQENEGDFPVASVNGEKIMASQIVTGVRNYVEQTGQSDLSPESIAEMRKNALNSIAIQQMLQNEAAKRKIKVPESEIDTAVKRIENQFPTKEAFQQYMENREIRMKDLREQIKMQLAQTMVLEAAAGEVEVTDEEAREFYGKAKDQLFHQPAGFNVMYARFMSMDVAEEARKALIDGAPWDEVVKKYEDKTTDFTLSGKPAFVTAREFTEGSLKPLNGTPIGKVSEALALSGTDVVVLIKEKKLDARVIPFDEAVNDVKAMIVEQKKKDKQNEYLKELMGQASIQILKQDFFEVPAEPKTEETGPAKNEDGAGE